MIGFNELKDITVELRDSDPQQEIIDLGVDDLGLLSFGREAGIKTMTIVSEGHPVDVALSALFVSGFVLGAKVAQQQAEAEVA